MKKYGAVIVENRHSVDVSDIIKRHKKFLPKSWDVLHIKDVVINSQDDYSRLLGSVYFWELVPFDKVLIFQADSGLLRNGIEEFLRWDYIGAPWNFQDHGGNGGLSLRSKNAMLETIKKLPYDVSVHGNEDVYFSNHLEGKLAPRSECEKFSVESIFKLGTLGYHQIETFHSKKDVETIKTQYENA